MLQIFQINDSDIKELSGRSVAIEKSLQALIENHLETFLGVRFLVSEYSTGKTHGGRIDTLGIDENGCPVIIEYKRSTNENVINQGLFYLDWLLDHKAEFKLHVLEKYDKKVANFIEWDSPRLLCIAGNFTRYDEHAVQQINRNIELIRYKKYGDELLLLELVNATTAQVIEDKKTPIATKFKTVSDYYEQASVTLRDLYEELKEFMVNLGDDVQIKTLKYYIAFKRIKNFACMEIHPQSQKLLLYLKVNPDSVDLPNGFARDVRNIGHFGTGDLEITIITHDDLERAKPYVIKSYEVS